MTRTGNEVEQAVSRTLRDSLEKLQRSTVELDQAVSDLVSACGSTRPANSLPPMLRAQTAAASLAASLDVLARFVTAALQPGLRSPEEQDAVSAVAQQPASEVSVQTPAVSAAPTAAPTQKKAEPAPVISEAAMESQPPEAPEELRAADMVEEGSPVATKPVEETPQVAEAQGSSEELTASPVISEESLRSQPVQPAEEVHASEMQAEGSPVATETAAHEAEVPAAAGEASSQGRPIPVTYPSREQGFSVSNLSPEVQELHKRANRVAKVSMQDIRMLRPNDVKLGKEHKDLCQRLRDDIERAHKEYDRRFQTILGHPVDYFYDWMVQILADGDPEALGEYPYPSPVLRH
jgi:hypothetical protein